MKRIVIAFLIPIAVMLLAPGCSMPGSTDASFCPRPTVIGDVEAGSVVADHGFVTARVTLTAEHPTVYIDMSGCAAYRTFAVSAGPLTRRSSRSATRPAGRLAWTSRQERLPSSKSR